METEDKSASHWQVCCEARCYRTTEAVYCSTTWDQCRLTAGIQATHKHLGGCLGSLGIWIARIVYPRHMWPIARSHICTLWMRTNFWDTSGESTYTPSSMNGFSLWLTLLCSSSHSLETRWVSFDVLSFFCCLFPFMRRLISPAKVVQLLENVNEHIAIRKIKLCYSDSKYKILQFVFWCSVESQLLMEKEDKSEHVSQCRSKCSEFDPHRCV